MRKPTNGNDNGGTALVSLDITKYPALVGGPEAVANLKTNLAGESFGPADLTEARENAWKAAGRAELSGVKTS